MCWKIERYHQYMWWFYRWCLFSIFKMVIYVVNEISENILMTQQNINHIIGTFPIKIKLDCECVVESCKVVEIGLATFGYCKYWKFDIVLLWTVPLRRNCVFILLINRHKTHNINTNLLLAEEKIPKPKQNSKSRLIFYFICDFLFLMTYN